MDHPQLGRRIFANPIYAVTVVKTDKALGEAAESLLILTLDLCGQNLPEVGETPSEHRSCPRNLSCQTGTYSVYSGRIQIAQSLPLKLLQRIKRKTVMKAQVKFEKNPPPEDCAPQTYISRITLANGASSQGKQLEQNNNSQKYN